MGEKGCPHCLGGLGLKHPLFSDNSDKQFLVLCDVHPLTEGHILIIPKKHIPCMGVLSEDAFERYKKLYEKVLNFLNETYGRTAIFEHGVTGQTVFHAHTHFLPFDGYINEIVPEKSSIRTVSTLEDIRTEFNKNHKYLYLAINNDKFLIDTKIGRPRFFRDRFAKALGAEERGNWKEARNSSELMKAFERDIKKLKGKWKKKAGFRNRQTHSP